MAVALLRWVAWGSLFTRKDRQAGGRSREVGLCCCPGAPWSQPWGRAFLDLPDMQEVGVCFPAEEVGSEQHSDLSRAAQLAFELSSLRL